MYKRQGLGREHLAQVLGGHIGAGQHDGHHPHDEAAHDDDHGVGDERDEVALSLIHISAESSGW